MPRPILRAAPALALVSLIVVSISAFGATAAPSAAGSTNPQFRPIDPNSSADSSNFAPPDYKVMQDHAPEVVTLTITTVKTTAAVADTPGAAAGALAVAARAVVTGVTRTNTDLKAGSVITLYYGYVPLKPGFTNPAPTPVVKENVTYQAFLTGGGGDNPYRAAAGAQSFLDPGAPGYSSTANAKSSGPVADPTLLATPTNPVVKGAPRLTGTALTSFVKLVQTNNHWAVTLANSDPIPLQVIGDATPVLLYYYGAPLRAPVTQPVIIVYRAGIQNPTPPATRVFTIERALILDGDKHLVGDVLWAPRAPDDDQPPPLLPAWTWFTYKLEIEDLESKKVQTILLSGQPAAASSTTSDTGK